MDDEIDLEAHERVMRKAAPIHMQTVQSDYSHAELHDLATDASPLLRPKLAKADSI